MLGQPVSMLIPQVVGFRLTGELPEGATATDLVLTVTQMLRERGVVGKFVEFFGPGLPEPAAGRPRHDRQHGARVRRDLRDLPRRRRDAALPRVLRPPARAGGAGRGLLPRAGPVPRRRAPRRSPTPTRSSSTSARSCPRWPGPKRPQDRVALSDAADDFAAELAELTRRRRWHGLRRGGGRELPGQRPADRRRRRRRAPKPGARPRRRRRRGGRARRGPRPRRGGDRRDHELHQHLEPVGHAGRRPAGQEGGRGRACSPSPWVKTSLAPGSKVVTEYLERAGLIEPLRAARLQPRGLRLHHLHRQLRPAAGGGLARDRGARPGGRARCCRATATSRGASTPR